MPYLVVDSNFFITAAGRNDNVSAQCVQTCNEMINLFYSTNTIICIDETNLILQEYAVYLNYSGNPTLADEYFRYLFENQGVATVCERVVIHNREHPELIFEQIPDDINLYGFDKNDQKFLAVAFGSKGNPNIVNATDSDWVEYQHKIGAHGIQICTVC